MDSVQIHSVRRVSPREHLRAGANLFSPKPVNHLAGKAFCLNKPPAWDESTLMLSSDSLQLPASSRPAEPVSRSSKETGLEQTQQLGRFLADVERRAYRIAVVALRDRDDAPDVVQGAMFRLVCSYRKRPSDEWRPLFYRILYNGIRDWRRRQAVRSRIFARRRPSAGGEDELFVDPVDLGADGWSGPGDRAMHAEAMQRLEQAIGELPLRQQQAFALRCLEGLDVAETAVAMKCSAGSVKTHYFRALKKLREQLGEVW